MVINKTKFLLDSEIDALETILIRNQDTDTRNVLLIWTALKTGARASEVLGIKKVDLNPEDQTVFIRGLKGSLDREIPVRQDIFTLLWNYSQTVRGELLFGISYQRLDQIWGMYRPVKKKFHALRHTFAIKAYDKTRDIRLVQTALGHSSIANSEIYLKYFYNQDQMRKLL